MKGNEGMQWAWCNGFVSFALHQVADILEREPIMPYFYGVDQMVDWAKSEGRFIEEADYVKVKDGDLFVNRHKSRPNDWVHTGIITQKMESSVFGTIEGNTNDEGSRDGYELCERTRSPKNKDFISMEV
jgi:hypothetical protein